MLIVLAILTVVIFVSCVSWFIDWWDNKPTYGLKIKFRQFLAMYKIDPNCWVLDRDGTVCYENRQNVFINGFIFHLLII